MACAIIEAVPIKKLKVQVQDSLLVSMLAGGILAFVPACILFYSLALIGILLLGLPPPPGPKDVDAGFILSALLLAPVIETFVLSLFLIVLYRFLPRIRPVSVMAGLVAAYFHHDSQGPYGIIAITWGFFVFSAFFLHWWKKSYWQAWLAAAVPHYLANLWLLGLNVWMLHMRHL